MLKTFQQGGHWHFKQLLVKLVSQLYDIVRLRA